MWKVLAIFLICGHAAQSGVLLSDPVLNTESSPEEEPADNAQGQSGVCGASTDEAVCDGLPDGEEPGGNDLRDVQSSDFPDFPDSNSTEIKPEFKPVCDSEGRVNVNPSFLEVANKALDANGKFDCPEENVTAPANPDKPEGQTLIISFRPLFCHHHICTLIQNFVCGTDGRTYYNECQLRLTSCSYPWRRLRILHFGRCRVPRVGLAGPGSILRCQRPCPRILQPVCGSNGRTYSNRCELENDRCFDQSLRVRNEGPCARCVKFCLRLFVPAPVCGSDGQTYWSRCELERVACLNPWRRLWVRREGRCSRMGLAAAFNDCDFKCNDDPIPACGTDGVNYRNPCKLYQTACNEPQKNLKLDHFGFCFSGQGANLCPDTCSRKKDPVCGNDGVTYHNLCHLKLQSCQTKNDSLAVASTGFCKNDVNACSWECPGVIAAVCGLDRQNVDTRKTFNNRCFLFKESCDKNEQNVDFTDRPCVEDKRDGMQLGSRTCFATSSTNGRAVRCKFPFVFRNNVYRSCTRVNFPFSWCATATNRRNEMTAWGMCNDLCETCECGPNCRCSRRSCPICPPA